MAIEKNLVCFAHGKESGPWGAKITYLAEIARTNGFAVSSPDYRFTHNPDERVMHLLQYAPKARQNLVLVGSSMGGYVAAMACRQLQPQALLLFAPALYFPGFAGEPEACPKETVVVHGWRDTIVPAEKALRFSRPRQAQLHLLDSEHTLNDQLPLLGQLLDQLLKRISPR